MKALPERGVSYGPQQYQHVVVKVENTFAVVKKSVSLEIKQHELETTSKLVWNRALNINLYPRKVPSSAPMRSQFENMGLLGDFLNSWDLATVSNT